MTAQPDSDPSRHDSTEPITDPLMAIGMFSRASLVSVKALRSYHELGLLVPASIDPDTGYRSYRVSQLNDAVIIKRLRDLDLPLKDIAEVVDGRDPEVTRVVIERHQKTMHERLVEVTRIVDGLHEAVERPSMHTPVHVRHDDSFHALTYSGHIDHGEYAAFLDRAYPTLYGAAAACGAVVCGPGGAEYPDSVDLEAEPVRAFVPIAQPVGVSEAVASLGVALALLPEARCAVATHIGGYDTIGDTYRRLGAWVARNAVSAERPVREHYVVSTDPDSLQLLPDDELRTEICWPITSLDPTTFQEEHS